MHRRSRSLALALALGLSVFVASNAQAVPTDVNFDLTITVNLPAFALTTFTGTGNMTIRFVNGTTGSHAGAGPLRQLGGTAMLAGSFTVLGDLFTGFQNQFFPLQPGFWGNATNPGTSLPGVFSLTAFGHVTSGFIHCTGTTCALASLPASIPVPLTSSPVIMQLAGLIHGLSGTAILTPLTFTGVGPGGTAFGQALTIQVTGVEVSRSHPVPEPTSGALLGLGLLSALGLGARRLRR